MNKFVYDDFEDNYQVSFNDSSLLVACQYS